MAAVAALVVVACCVGLLPSNALAAARPPAAESKHATDAPSTTVAAGPAPNFTAIMEQCNETYRIDMKLLQELNNTGSFREEKDETPMCYLHCVFDKGELMDTDGTFNVVRVKDMYRTGAESESRRAQMDDMVAMCILQRDETDHCRRVYGFVSCLMTEEIIRFGTPMTRGVQHDA
ncbi:hypothetical protein R5R35_000825 [Gryllus longicercus]|uniref:Odorant binding protein n=1 Tax=Gryllus longicercus TaxID=2509291 RepID=A0AAN9Z151_9ORTH